MIIDFHTHIFSPEIRANRARYAADDPCFAELYSSEKATLITADELIEAMDREGVDMAVALNIGWCSNRLCRETNDYIMESVARYPDRLIGFCSVQPGESDAALRELERCVSGGVRGVGEIRPDTQGIAMGDPGVTDVLAACMIENDLILLPHMSEPVGHLYQGKGSVTPDVLYPFITRYPELTIVAAHWGGGLPFYMLMPEVKKALSNVYFDTAASPFLYTSDVYTCVAGLAGPDRILFGTDFPLIRPGRLIAEIESLAMEPEVKAKILGGNAMKLLGISGG